jgi:hypothetical protein
LPEANMNLTIIELKESILVIAILTYKELSKNRGEI